MMDELDPPDVFDRIVCDPRILSGKPTVKGTRISVQIILEWFASGATAEYIAAEYPPVTVADVYQALMYAAAAMGAKQIRPACTPAPEPAAASVPA